MTLFTKVQDSFLSKVTDDMQLELDKTETEALLEELLLQDAIPMFEFPRIDLDDIGTDSDDNPYWNIDLTNEEINILATYMVCAWLDQQINSVENTRQKYTGADFKMTSQANHLKTLQSLRKDWERKGLHLQRLYSRRKKNENGVYQSTFGEIMSSSTNGYARREADEN